MEFTLPSGILPGVDPGLDPQDIQLPWVEAVPFNLQSQWLHELTRDTTFDWRRIPAPVQGITSTIQLTDDGLGVDPWVPTLWAEVVSTVGAYDPNAQQNILRATVIDATPGAEQWRVLWSTGLTSYTREQLTLTVVNVLPPLASQPTEPTSLTLTINGLTYIPALSPGLAFDGNVTLTWTAAQAGFVLRPSDLIIAEYF